MHTYQHLVPNAHVLNEYHLLFMPFKLFVHLLFYILFYGFFTKLSIYCFVGFKNSDFNSYFTNPLFGHNVTNTLFEHDVGKKL